jgi:Fic family protein
MLEALKASIERRKAELGRLRPLSTAALAQLQKHYDVELTYTSNAIEGNTLTLRETAEVIEHGITVGGKSLRDHLEAVDHYEALLWMRRTAATTTVLSEGVVCELHRRIVARSQSEIAGRYSDLPRRIAGSPVIFPNPRKIPQLMEAFGSWLGTAGLDPETSFAAHFRLTAIHPFADGNGRTARLLMNLMLIRGGFPPVAVRPEDRKTYLDSLEHGSLADELAPFQFLLHQRLDSTLEDYLDVVREATSPD